MRRERVKSYEEAAHALGQSPERGTGQRGTKIVRLSPVAIAVRYHHTDVVTYYHPEVADYRGKATIRSGGWGTHTTVDRINEYAPEGVYAELAEWNREAQSYDAVIVVAPGETHTLRSVHDEAVIP